REGRRDHLRIRETELAELCRKLRCGLGVVRFDPHLHEERLDESGVAPLVHPLESPAEDTRRVTGAYACLGRGTESDELVGRAAPATTIPEWMPMRRPSSIPSWAFTRAACSLKIRCIPRAQRSARCGSSSCAIGAPKITKMASPMNFSIVPSYRRASSASSSKIPETSICSS